MKKRIFYPLFCCCAFLSLPLMAQQSPLLEKYRMMALDYNHDLKAIELWRLSFSFATDLYGRTCIGVYPYGETSTIIGKQSGGGTE